MRAEDLDHEELLELEPERGLIRFAGQRALLLDAVAMGLLRKYLAENFGQTVARTVLTQFGFAHGWRMAEALSAQFQWDSDDDWQRAGTRIHALGGLFSVGPNGDSPLAPGGVTLTASYEAEQHLLHDGLSEVPVCRTICGLTSGYLSRATGQEIYVLEDRCIGMGDAACHLVGRTREAWGEARAEEVGFFHATHLHDSLDASLRRVTTTLKAAERTLRAHRQALLRIAQAEDEPMGIVCRSAPMRRVVDLARRVARVDSTVLITGESGVGKERVARLVHDQSTRAAGPFVAVNCGAITETLLESELFGHARGAFTGATHDRPGLFEAATGGTLLLDEVGEISTAMQVKLLRVLQERELRRVGENRSRKVDVRILAATNQGLTEQIRLGLFREDLYYRLRVVELSVPALRERRDDILPLARVLLAAAAQRMEHPPTSLSPAVADQLLRYPWPGNVRELGNAMERAAALARGAQVEVEDLPEELRPAHQPMTPVRGAVRTLKEVEKDYILAVLALNDGNQTRAAAQLKIGTATLYRRLKAYGLIGNRDSAPPA